VAQRVLAHTLDALLRLLHPMIPFLTEDVWQRLAQAAPKRGIDKIEPAAESIMTAPWPEHDARRQDAVIEEQFAQFQQVLRAINNIRGENNIPLKTRIKFSLLCNMKTAQLLSPLEPQFLARAGAQLTASGPEVKSPKMATSIELGYTYSNMKVYVDMAEWYDVDAEIERLMKLKDKLAVTIESQEKKLQNQYFVNRAPADVVNKERSRLEDLRSQFESTLRSLEMAQQFKKEQERIGRKDVWNDK